MTAGVNPELLECPVIGCGRPAVDRQYLAVVTSPEGRQRAVHGCVDHIAVLVAREVSRIRTEPFD